MGAFQHDTFGHDGEERTVGGNVDLLSWMMHILTVVLSRHKNKKYIVHIPQTIQTFWNEIMFLG